MSVYTAHNRNNRDILGIPSSQKSSSLNVLTHSSRRKLHLNSGMSECENDDPLSRSANKIRDINSTYVISACKKTGEVPLTPDPPGRLALQRRVTRNKESSLRGSELGDSTEKTAETRLTLQRRAKTESVEKWKTAQTESVEKWKTAQTDCVKKWKTTQNVGSPTENDCASLEMRRKVTIVNNGKDSSVASFGPLAKDRKDTEMMADEKHKETSSALLEANEHVTLQYLSNRAPTDCQSQTKVVPSGHLATKPLQSKLNIKVPGTGNLHHRSIGKDIAKNSNKFGSLEKRTPTKYIVGHKWTPKCGTLQLSSPAASILKNRVPSLQVKQKPRSSLLANEKERSQENTLLLEEETTGRNTSIETDPLKVENSQVTVAIRVRPFSKREKVEKASQVVFMNGEEIAVEHPDMKQVYNFIYDVAFWSFDECHPNYASQTTVYETLAVPLLERAFEGYNTCLFAYVYNEKIHDLLVCKGENGQRKQPSWLELGNKQRATAATGMNDKSSRSHSVFTLVMTQTKTESVEGEEHDHRITSRINLIDLAGKSLGGNSKTAMIATISPAANNIEETLSTLRYASQARMIVNIAKVNEDMNAKLIRELKAEIEKLKAAQRNSQNIDPERYRLCRQEITSLRMKLHQQERDMAEMQRAWKEKFEQAERRKLQETKELQKAGITFQIDNHLPNFVNLNEDPQLSEMLLYMIKEGTTTVGKYKPNSSHDIQLSGVLIADDHCTIKNFDGIGDRVILGGDHYFRFNHPVEVQKGKRPSGRDILIIEGPKDFEFAKNELLMAQRSQLEAEIKEAQLRAKEEMMQGIQIAKEMAQQELSSQKAAYESKIKALEAELKEEAQRKKMQEINNQKANDKIEELEKAKQRLEQEIYVNKKRLEMETLAAKQALEDHSIRHARILEALETEKQKIAKEVQILQQNQSNRDKTFLIQTNWSSMKLSMMIQEANAISSKFKKCYVFGRHDVSDKGSSSDTSVRVRNLQLGISTFWSLEKFESKLAAMKELYEMNGNLTLQMHQFLLFLEGGLLEKSSTIYSSSAESFLPGICKELIGSSLDFLGQSYDEEKTMADSLINNFLKIYHGLFAISKAHEEQDEEMFSSDRATQAFTIQVTCAFEQLVVLIKHWLNDTPPCTSTARLEDELRQEVKKLGGYLQLFLQGCCSDISSMVKEAQKKIIQIVQQAVKYVGQLAVLKGSKLHFLENSSNKAASVQEDFMDALCDGIGLGMKILLDSGVEKAKELQHELLRRCTQNEVAKQMKAKAMGLIGCLENMFAEWKTKSFRTELQQENSGYQDLKKMVNLAPEFLKLKHCLEQTIQIIISALRGFHSDKNLLKNCVESLCNLAKDLHDDLNMRSTSLDSCEKKIPQVGHGGLESLVKSLLLCFESEERPDLLNPWETCNQNTREEGQQSKSSRTDSVRNKGVPKQVYELHGSSPAVTAEDSAPIRIQWV
ncbi:hypothetical protein GH733_010679 [Mirounga leonina]|nr:hypothetical protein GH733_010679 [Mirounga leonina]